LPLLRAWRLPLSLVLLPSALLVATEPSHLQVISQHNLAKVTGAMSRPKHDLQA
jgi:hypothetical protein